MAGLTLDAGFRRLLTIDVLRTDAIAVQTPREL
jgi:hypothetical protein